MLKQSILVTVITDFIRITQRAHLDPDAACSDRSGSGAVMPRKVKRTPSLPPMDPDFVKRTLEAFPEEGVCDADQALVSMQSSAAVWRRIGLSFLLDGVTNAAS